MMQRVEARCSSWVGYDMCLIECTGVKPDSRYEYILYKLRFEDDVPMTIFLKVMFLSLNPIHST